VYTFSDSLLSVFIPQGERSKIVLFLLVALGLFLLGWLVAETDIVVTPAREPEWASSIEGSHVDRLARERLSCLLAELALQVGSPGVELAFLCEGKAVLQTAPNLGYWLGNCGDNLGLKSGVVVTKAKLPHFVGSPRVNDAFRANSDREVLPKFQIFNFRGSLVQSRAPPCAQVAPSTCESNFCWFLEDRLFFGFFAGVQVSAETPHVDLPIFGDAATVAETTSYGPRLDAFLHEEVDQFESGAAFLCLVPKGIAASITAGEQSVQIGTDESMNAPTGHLHYFFAWFEALRVLPLEGCLLFFRVPSLLCRVTLVKTAQVNRFGRLKLLVRSIENAFAGPAPAGLPVAVVGVLLRWVHRVHSL